MARSTKATVSPAQSATVRAKGRVAGPATAPVASRAAVAKAKAVTEPAALKAEPTRDKAAAKPVSAAAAARVPPPSKGELRAQIEKLEAANTALKAKGREANRAAKIAARRIIELEEQVAQFQQQAAKPPTPAVPDVNQRNVPRGRPPGSKKEINSGDAVPPGVAVGKAEPLDADARAARAALEENLSGE